MSSKLEVLCSTSYSGDVRREQREFWERWCGPFWIVVLMIIVSLLLLFACFLRLSWEQNRILFPLYLMLATISVCCLWLVNCVDPGTVEAENIPFLPEQLARNRDYEAKGLLTNAFSTRKEPLNPEMALEKEFQDQNGRIQKYKWCTTCLLWRPPRSSHCNMCNKCFKRFDHHCLLVGNCIAQNNHRFFSSFLILIGLAWLVGLIAAILRLSQVYSSGNNSQGSWDTYIVLFFVLISICYVPVLLGFGVYHGTNVLCDYTTRERLKNLEHEKDLQQNFIDICFSPITVRT